MSSGTRDDRTGGRGRGEGGATLARLAAVAALIAAAALLALAVLGGSGGYTVTATFDDAGQLVEGNQVQVGGRAVGRIESIGLDGQGRAEIRMSVDDELAPLSEGTTATIRTTSLSGIANRYVSLHPGPNSAAAIPDGGRIGADRTSAPVDLDQLFNTLDPATRRGLQQLIAGSAQAIDGRSREARRTARYLSPALFTTSRLTREIALDEEVFERFVLDTSTVVGSLAARRDELASLVGNANATAGAIADEDAALGAALAQLPDTLRRANTTFVNLRSTLDDLDALVTEARPATRELAPLLRRLRPLVRDARPTIRDLRRLIGQPGADNDLIELTAKQPRLAALTATVFPRAIRTLRRAQPVVEYARDYTPDLAGWFTKFGQGAANYDANGHFARIQPIFSGFSFSDGPAGGVLRPLAPRAPRLTGFSSGNDRRCPGGAMQPTPDGSAPRVVEDCDPSSSP
ncbi:MAG: MlaD family protein [Nocardioidaceae bacterium]